MIRVRPARSEDVPLLMEITRHSGTAGRWNEKDYAKLFTSGATPGPAVLVVQEDDQVLGFLVGRPISRDHAEWEIENVAVSRPARRRGLGSHLLGEFLRLVRERGGRDVFLEVRESNQAARNLYEKWAFVETGRRKAYYQDPCEDALVMRLSFPQSS